MATEDESIGIGPAALGAVLPFTFSIDETGTILFATPSVSRLIAKSGENFFDRVSIETPNFSGLGAKENKANSLLVFASKSSGIRVRGVFIPASSNKFIFVGALNLASADDVIRYRLTLADFTSFDTVFDKLLLLQVQKKTISDLKDAQTALIAERSKSIQSAKLASLGEMSAGIAHEINNPLAIIEVNASLLQKYINDPSKFAQKIERIKKSCMRISKIISGLRKFSRSGESVPYELASISSIATEALALAEVRAKQHSVSTFVELKSDSAILCNEVEIEQVFINLINNAIDAAKSSQEKWVKVSVIEEEKYVVIRVIDSGSGLPDQVRNKVFQPFFTTKQVGEGTGLGLSITKGILDEHKATISIPSDLPNTCFEVRFLKSQAKLDQKKVG